MARESTQHKLDDIRRPRVQITYDLDIGDAIERKELPFVLGVMGDYSGHRDPDKPLPKLKKRKFVAVDRDNFDSVLAGTNPRLQLRVKNRLRKGADERLSVELNFASLQDFEPDRLVQHIKPLRKLIEARNRLADLRSKVSSNEEFEEVLREVLRNTEELQRLGHAVGVEDRKEPVEPTGGTQ